MFKQDHADRQRRRGDDRSRSPPRPRRRAIMAVTSQPYYGHGLSATAISSLITASAAPTASSSVITASSSVIMTAALLRPAGLLRHSRQRCGNGTTGLIVGGAAGALIGREVERSGSRNRYYGNRSSGTTGAIIGGALGALVGREVARSC